MKIQSLTMSRKKTQDYQSRGAEVVLELGPGDTYRDAVYAGNVLLAVALGEAPAQEAVDRAKALLDRAREVQVVEASVAAPLPQAPKRRGRPPGSGNGTARKEAYDRLAAERQSTEK
jgi:hypothetical protein